jgi:hypothetical protein
LSHLPSTADVAPSDVDLHTAADQLLHTAAN